MFESIPRETTFELPEGNYAASISGLKKFTKQSNKGIQEHVRLSFDVNIPSRANFVNKAGRNFKKDFNNGSDLRNFLTGLLGRKYFHNLSGKQMNLESLVGMKCELELEHYSNGEYEHPMVMVNSCHEPGTLNLTEKPSNSEGEE